MTQNVTSNPSDNTAAIQPPPPGTTASHNDITVIIKNVAPIAIIEDSSNAIFNGSTKMSQTRTPSLLDHQDAIIGIYTPTNIPTYHKIDAHHHIISNDSVIATE